MDQLYHITLHVKISIRFTTEILLTEYDICPICEKELIILFLSYIRYRQCYAWDFKNLEYNSIDLFII